MANNTTLDPGAGGDTIRDVDHAGVKTPVVGIDLNIAGAESLMAGSMPVNDNAGSLTVDGTVAVSGTTTTQDNQTLVDNAAFTDGTSKIFPVGLIFDEVAGTALTENDVAAARIDSKRASISVIEDETTRGRRTTVTAANALKVDGSAVIQPVSGTITANAGTGTFTTADNQTVTDNAGFTDGTTKVFMAGYIFDETAGTALTENDAAAPRIDSKRSTVSVIEDATTRGQRAAVSAANALKVDGSAVTQPISGAVTGSGTFTVADNQVVADDAAFTVGTTKLQGVGFLADQTSTDSVDEGDIGAARITLDRKQIVTLGPDAATEGLSFYSDINLTNTDVSIKASAGKLYGWYIYNDGAAEIYVKLYDASTASVTVGSTAPNLRLAIPAGSAANVEFTMGIAFATAITVAATTGFADADATAPAANQVVANFFYK